MSFLTAAQSAAIRLVGRRPQGFFSSTDTFELEICDLATEVAADLMKENDWRILTKLQEVTGNSVLTSFDLPTDFDRMPIKAAVFRPDWNAYSYQPVGDLDQWRNIVNGAPTGAPGSWIILGGQMQIYPAIASGSKAQFYYISKNVVLTGTTPSAAFTTDDDKFVLDDRLLTLGLIWKWRAQKRIEYAEDMANYEKALAEIAGRDKGSRIHVEGRPTFNQNAGRAYPWGGAI